MNLFECYRGVYSPEIIEEAKKCSNPDCTCKNCTCNPCKCTEETSKLPKEARAFTGTNIKTGEKRRWEDDKEVQVSKEDVFAVEVRDLPRAERQHVRKPWSQKREVKQKTEPKVRTDTKGIHRGRSGRTGQTENGNPVGEPEKRRQMLKVHAKTGQTMRDQERAEQAAKVAAAKKTARRTEAAIKGDAMSLPSGVDARGGFGNPPEIVNKEDCGKRNLRLGGCGCVAVKPKKKITLIRGRIKKRKRK